MPNPYREMLAKAIESNGGYSSGYRGSFALEWTVGLYYADLSKDHIHEVMLKAGDCSLPLHDKLEWDEQQQWNWGQWSMYEGLNDDDGNRTYSPATAKRFGLDYERFPQQFKRRTNECAFHPAKKPGWIRVDPYSCEYFDVVFELHGRGGKHLVPIEFEGRSLRLHADDLAERIREDDEGIYPNWWCQRLLAMIAEWDECFTSEKASAELEYLAASRMAQDLEELHGVDEERAIQQESLLATAG